MNRASNSLHPPISHHASPLLHWTWLVFMFLMLGTSACQKPKLSVFEDQDLGISVGYPTGWEMRDEGLSELTLFMPNREVKDAHVHISSQSALTPASVEEYVLDQISQKAEHLVSDEIVLEQFTVDSSHRELPVTQTVYYINAYPSIPASTLEYRLAVVEFPSGFLVIETASTGSGARVAMQLLLANIDYNEG